MSTLRIVLLTCLCASSVSWTPAAAEPSRAFVIDQGTLLAFDPETGRTTGSIPLGGQPDRLFQTDDGRLLIVLDPGPRKLTFRYGYHPKGKSSAAIVDPSALMVVGRAELGWNLEQAAVTSDQQYLVAYCSGYRSQKAEETLPRELMVVSLRTGQVSARVPLERPVHALLTAKDGRTAILFTEQEKPEKAPAAPAEIRFVSLESGRALSTLPLPGAPGSVAFSNDGDYLYLLDRGEPSSKPEKNVNGRLHVVSVPDRALRQVIDVGSDPKLAKDELDVFVLSNGAVTAGSSPQQGELRVLRGDSIAATVKTGSFPSFVRRSPDRGALYVVSPGLITAVKIPSFETAWHMPLGSTGGSVLSGGLVDAAFDEKHVNEFVIAPDGRRGFALYEESSKLLVVDLENPGVVASVTTGRGSVKFAKFLGAMAATAASAAQAQSIAATQGLSYGTYQVYGVAAARTAVAIRSDGKYAYVLNTNSNDVTVVDSQTGQVVTKIAGGGSQLMPLPGGRLLAVLGDSSLKLIDMGDQKAMPEVQFDGWLRDLLVSPDGRRVLAWGFKQALFLDPSSGRVVGAPTELKLSMAGLFAGPATVELTKAHEDASQTQVGGAI